MQKRLTILLVLLVLSLLLVIGQARAQNESASPPTEEITPGENISMATFMADGELMELGEKGVTTCHHGERMFEDKLFCISKVGRYACVSLEFKTRFTLIPVDGKQHPPFDAIGYSSDKEKFPVKIYSLIPCE